MLVNMKELLKNAQDGGYAVGSFSVANMEMILGTQFSRKLRALRRQPDCTLEACLQLYKSGWLHTATAVTDMKRSVIEVKILALFIGNCETSSQS